MAARLITCKAQAKIHISLIEKFKWGSSITEDSSKWHRGGSSLSISCYRASQYASLTSGSPIAYQFSISAHPKFYSKIRYKGFIFILSSLYRSGAHQAEPQPSAPPSLETVRDMEQPTQELSPNQDTNENNLCLVASLAIDFDPRNFKVCKSRIHKDLYYPQLYNVCA